MNYSLCFFSSPLASGFLPILHSAPFKSYQPTTSSNVVKQFSPSQKFINAIKSNKNFYFSKLIAFVYDILLLIIYQDCFWMSRKTDFIFSGEVNQKHCKEIKVEKPCRDFKSPNFLCLPSSFCHSALSEINVMICQKGLGATAKLFFTFRIFGSSSSRFMTKIPSLFRIDFSFVGR